MADHIPIYTDLLKGRDEITQKLEELNKRKDELSNKAVKLKFDALEVDKAINSLKQLKNELTSRKEKLSLDLSNVDTQLKRAKDRLNELKARLKEKQQLGLDTSYTTRKIKEVESTIKNLSKQRITIQDNIQEVRTRIQQVTEQIRQRLNQKSTLNVDAKQAELELRECTKELNLLDQALKNASVDGQSSATSIANAFGKVASVFEGINRLNPFTNILRLAKGTIVSRATHELMSNVSGGIERFDIVKNFKAVVPEMLNLQNGTAQAEKAINQLKESVLGLPTGLDEIVDSAKRFISTTGDIEKGTRLAIAANRAFLASGADAQQQYFGTKQLQDLMAAGKLRSQEWESLLKAMPLASRKIGEYMGYAGDKYGEFRQLLKSGKIDAKEFLDALEEVGNEGGVIYKLAENYKDLMSAVISNVGNALKRGYESVLKTLDDMFYEETGQSLAKNLSKITSGIDNIFANMTDYMKAHKEELFEFYEAIRQFPIQSFVKAMGAYVRTWAKLIEILAKVTSKMPNVTTFLMGVMAFSGPLGKVFRLLERLFILLAGVKVFKGAPILGSLTTKIFGKGGVAKATSSAKGITAAAGSFKTAFLKIGEVAAVLATAELAIWGASKSLQELYKLKDYDFGTLASQLVKAVTAIGSVSLALYGLGQTGIAGLKSAVIGGIIAGIADLIIGFTGLSLKSFSKGVSSLADSLGKLQSLNIDTKKIRENLLGLSQIFVDIRTILTPKHKRQGKSTDYYKDIKDTLSSVKTAISYLLGTSQDLVSISKKVPNISKDVGSRIGEAISGITNMMKKTDFDSLSSKIPSLLTADTSLGTLSLLSQKLSSISKNIKYVDVKIGDKFKAIFDNLNKSFAGISVDSLISKLIELQTANGSLSILTIVAENLNKINKNISNVSSTIGEKLANAISSINLALSKLNIKGGLLEKAQILSIISSSIKASINSLRNAAKNAAGDNGFGLLASSISNCIEQINKLNGLKIKEKTIKVKDEFTSPINSFIRKMREASSVQNVNKTINVTTNNYTNPVRNTINKILNPHTGGYVGKTMLQYRQKGGEIFKPKGTDTVPAMLTPGEYVVKRNAVKHFGIDFMRRINNLDFDGAFKDLSFKAGSRVSQYTSNRNISNVVNNNRHNDVTINNNYKHNTNPEFKAGRLVRSLG